MNKIVLSLGSNQGDRIGWLKEAVKCLKIEGFNIVAQSSIYETKAWGVEDQPDFLNQCLIGTASLSLTEVFDVVRQIEDRSGRQRTIKWGPRTLDIDILFFNDEVSVTHDLTIPHPYLHERKFVLLPLAEIAPGWMHPLLHKTVNQLLSECKDDLEIQKWQ